MIVVYDVDCMYDMHGMYVRHAWYIRCVRCVLHVLYVRYGMYGVCYMCVVPALSTGPSVCGEHAQAAASFRPFSSLGSKLLLPSPAYCFVFRFSENKHFRAYFRKLFGCYDAALI